MLIIRPTASLAHRMKVKLTDNGESSDTLLGDWSAIDLHICRQQLILAVCEKARLGVLCKAAPYSSWPERFIKSTKVLLLAIGIDPVKVDEEVLRMREFFFAKTNNRSVLGSINDYRAHIEFRIQSGRNSPEDYLDLGQLSETPVSILKYQFPREVAAEILSL